MSRKQTQLVRVLAEVDALKIAITEERNHTLQTILNEAQNAPPDGVRDGSINEIEWDALRDLVEGLKKAESAMRALRQRELGPAAPARRSR